MPLKIETGRGKAVRDAVLAHFARNPDAELTGKELFDCINEIEHRTDLADILGQMVKAGDIVLGADRAPNTPGGMSGSGARGVRAYRLPSDIRSEEPAPYMIEIPDHDIGAETVTIDPLIAQLIEHEFKIPSLTDQDAQRIRALASTTLFNTQLPDWSLYLHGLADRITARI